MRERLGLLLQQGQVQICARGQAIGRGLVVELGEFPTRQAGLVLARVGVAPSNSVDAGGMLWWKHHPGAVIVDDGDW